MKKLLLPTALVFATSLMLAFLFAAAESPSPVEAKPEDVGDSDIELPFYSPEIQILKSHLRAVVSVINRIPACKLLIWGVGHDSKLWCTVNKGGTTVFIEDSPKWAAMAAEQMPCRIVMTTYDTERRFADELLGQDDALELEIPADVRKMKFDVIVVDGPAGWKPEAPGRMQSIFMSSKLAHAGSHIFVDDYRRHVESVYAVKYLEPLFGPPRVLPGRLLFAHFALHHDPVDEQ